MCHKYNPLEVNYSEAKGTYISCFKFLLYPFNDSVPIWPNCFISGTNTSYEGIMWYKPFPWVTMFLYQFVCRHRQQTFVHVITSDQLVRFISFLVVLVALTFRLARFWSIFAGTLTFSFQGEIWNLLYLSQKWSYCHEEKANTSIKF